MPHRDRAGSLARLARHTPAPIAARRLAADPQATYRTIAGAVLATFVTGMCWRHPRPQREGAGLGTGTAFVVLVAACSLTVAALGALIERRRALALLRAAGM